MAKLRESTDIIKGSKLMVFIKDNNTLVPIAFATSHSFQKQLNTQEITCKDFGDASAILPQNYTWTMTTDNLYSVDGYWQVNGAFKQMKKVTVYFGSSNYSNDTAQESIVDVEGATEWTTSGFGEQGEAYITDLQVTAQAGENATFTATFTGTGALTEINAQVGG